MVLAQSGYKPEGLIEVSEELPLEGEDEMSEELPLVGEDEMSEELLLDVCDWVGEDERGHRPS